MPRILDVYLKMPYREIIAELQRKEKSMLEMQQIIEQIQETRKSQRAEHMRKMQHDVLWGNVITPLNKEVQIVKGMARYVSKAYAVAERTKAVDEYLKVLLKARNLLNKYHKAYELTPRRLSKEKGVPNNGEHWTDWIPESVKLKITVLFDSIPRRYKAKTKTPFERTIDEATNLEKRIALKKRTEKTLDAALREHAANPNEDTEEELNNIRKALKILDSAKIPDNAPVPLTWHGVLKHWG